MKGVVYWCSIIHAVDDIVLARVDANHTRICYCAEFGQVVWYDLFEYASLSSQLIRTSPEHQVARIPVRLDRVVEGPNSTPGLAAIQIENQTPQLCLAINESEIAFSVPCLLSFRTWGAPRGSKVPLLLSLK